MPDGMPESSRDATTVTDRLIDDFVLARLQGRAVDLDTLLAGLDAHHQREVRRRLDALGKTGFGRGQVLPAQLGEFTPEAELGRGGMSVVYRARQTSLGRVVALKVLATAGSSAHDNERFLREARALARLHHPGIVPVLSAGEQDGLLWFAMELVDGSSLANLLAAIAATPPKHRTAEQFLTPLGSHSITATATSYVALIARIVADAAEALEHAHGCGILHRDIKPSNIMIDRTGRVRLIDFGLARARDGSSMELTHTHELLGSPSWLPPELLRTPKREPSPRGDIYSLGVVLYEALAGRRPHVAGNVPLLLRKIANVPATPLQRFHTGLPRDLVTICHTAIERDPVRRYASAHAFGKDLKAVLAFEPIAARPPNLGRRSVLAARRYPRTAAATALALGGVLLLSGTVVFQSVQRDSHRRALVSTIEGLAANGSLEAADADLRRLDGLAPEHPDTRRVARVVAEVHCAELTHRAQALTRELAGARVDWEQLDKRIVSAMISARSEHVPREREQQALADRLAAAKLEAKLRASYQTVVTLSERAAIDTRLSSEASTAKLHAALAEALMEGWRHALRRGDQEWIRLCADRVRVLDHPRRFASELTARSHVALTGAGAQVFLFRYVPCHELRPDELSARWVPVPCSCDGSLHAGPFGSFRPGDTCLVVRDATDAGLLLSDLILTIGDEPAGLGYRIRTVIPESAAARAGVEPYARLVSVGGQPAADWWQIRATLDSRQDVEVHVRQNGQVIRYHATWREDTYDTLGAVLEQEHLLLWDAPPPRDLRLGILRGGQPTWILDAHRSELLPNPVG
jgi:serine/threonine protein kinase